MSSIAEIEFIQLLHERRFRLPSKANSRFRTVEDSTPGVGNDDSDQGLIMNIDSLGPLERVKLFDESQQSVPGFALSSAFILQTKTIPDILLKKINQLSALLQKEGARLLPILLYISLLVLGFQAMAVVILLSSACLPLGLCFLLSCIGMLAGLYLYTYSVGQSRTSTPTPTPSQSLTSLSSYAS